VSAASKNLPREDIPGSMIFNSLIFAVFFAIVLFLHAMPFSWRTKKINLLIASYIF
jgi:alginate O-acetyltransferase complex protein AlgI